MDFYRHQDKAKSKTFWLFTLFFLGIFLLSTIASILTNVALTVSLQTNIPTYSLHSFIYVFMPIATVTLLLSFFKYLAIRGGGKRVAETLKAKLIDRNSNIDYERKLLNVVEEMAIAANMPVPPVYLLESDVSINAFAAGFSVNDAVIGVTRGAVLCLTREELQAVIAHEISHILNGDMRINMRLIAVLFGFSFLMEVARELLNAFRRGASSSSSKGSSSSGNKGSNPLLAILLVSIIFYIFGCLSALWSQIMQAAINRQREYLADASAAQFTRYPKSLASALMKIGGSAYGSNLGNANANSYSHLFFASTFDGLLSTHPPLSKRIKRLYPSWDGNYPISDPLIDENDLPTANYTGISKEKAVAAAVISAAGSTISTLSNDPNADTLPFTRTTSILNTQPITQQQAIEQLDLVCREPMDACYFIFALLLDDDPSIRVKQFTAVKQIDLVKKYHQTLVTIPQEQHLEFIEKAIPTLKMLSEPQYKKFKRILMHFIQADNEVSLLEWLVYQLILHQVEAQYNTKQARKEPKYRSAQVIQNEIGCLLSAIAWLASNNMEDVKRSFGMGSNTMGLYTLTLTDTPPATVELTPCLEKLQQATEEIRRKFLRAALCAIEQDNNINAQEAMFLRVLSLCLDCPVALYHS